jgi:hypothetical protein
MARGPAQFTPNPSWYRHQPACKPGSVGPRPLARTERDGHSSGTTLARCLEQPTRIASLTPLPQALSLRERPALPSLFGLAPGGVYLAGSVAGPAVRSYRTFSPLLPLTRKRFVLCGTFPGVAPAGCYPAPYVDGARTFLSQGLSTRVGAAVRPTDVQGMGFMAAGVKPLTAGESPQKIIIVKMSFGDRSLRLVVGDDAVSQGVKRCNIC